MRGALAALHGNLASREMLDRLLDRGKLPHGLCLAGPRGVGKRTTALAVARCLDCLGTAAADCRCVACRKVVQGIHPDVRTFEADGTTFKIDQVRQVIDLVRLKPYEGRAKVFILDDADTMNEEAGNAILKTLEEPPPDTYLLLTTSRPDALLPTIRSRCRMVRFQALPSADLLEVLRSRGMPDDEARQRAMFAGGSVGTALSLDLAEAVARRQRILDLLRSLSAHPAAAEILAIAKRESGDRDELDASMETLKLMARDMAVLGRGLPADRCVFPDLAGDLSALAGGLPASAPLSLFRQADALRDAVRRNAARQIATEVLLLSVRDVLSGTPGSAGT